MSAFDNVKLVKKLALVFSVLLAVFIASGVFSIVRINDLGERTSDIARNWMPTVKTLANIETLVVEHRQLELTHIVATDAAGMAEGDQRVAELR